MKKERLLQTFLDLVKIDSPSKREGKVASYCKEQLESLGFTVCFDSSAALTGSETGNLVAWLPATVSTAAATTTAASMVAPAVTTATATAVAPVTSSNQPIVLTSHMDCVQPCEGVSPQLVEDVSKAKGMIVSSDGSTVLGSDDKAGVAAILEAARCVVESGVPHKGIVIVFTVCEEIGCLGAKYLEQELFDKALCQAAGCEISDLSDASGPICGSLDSFAQTAEQKADESDNSLIPCVVFDSDGAAGTIIVGAPYHYTFSAEIMGRASHAGVEPEAGVSAISIAARALDKVEWGRLDEMTTSNVGRIEGGQVNNIVAQACHATGECRSLEQERVEEVRDQITDAFEQAAEEFGLPSFSVIEVSESAESNVSEVGTTGLKVAEPCATEAEVLGGGATETETSNPKASEGGIPEEGIALKWTLEYPGFFYSENDELIQLLSHAVRQAGLEPVYKTTGGGSDANVLAAKGVSPVVVGVGMTDFHTTNEYIAVNDLEGAALFAENLMSL